MATTSASKGQVTIPRHIRDALQLQPGAAVEFSVNADVRWRTDELMKLLRAEG